MDYKGDLVTLLPPVAVSTVTFLGYGLQQWVFILTILYTGMMITKLLVKLGIKLFKLLKLRRNK